MLVVLVAVPSHEAKNESRPLIAPSAIPCGHASFHERCHPCLAHLLAMSCLLLLALSCLLLLVLSYFLSGQEILSLSLVLSASIGTALHPSHAP